MAGRRQPELTDNEGSVLGLVHRRQPISAYQLMRIFIESPVTALNDNKGTIYPVVRRLKGLKLLSAQEIPGDNRKTELLSCTDLGLEELKRWVRAVRPPSVLLEDPLRTRLMWLDLLSHEEKLAWVSDVTAIIGEKLREIEGFTIGWRAPYNELLEDNLLAALRQRKAWISKIKLEVESEAR